MTDKEPGKKPRLTAYFVPVIALFLLGVLIGYQYQKQMIKDPDTRFKIAHEALIHADDARAFKLFSSLAEAGDGRAQYWLADMYENGYGIKKDIGKALELYEKSAAQENLPAEARLGEIYLMGEETVQNFAKARQWLKKSANRGNARAERLLGQMDAHGLGSPEDVVSAYAWYQMAVLDGDGLAMHLRDKLLETLSESQIIDGQALAERLIKEIKETADARDKSDVAQGQKISRD